jgi:hypothetical protein
MRDSIDPINSTLLDKVMEIKREVYEGNSDSPEQKAIAWRVADSEEDTSVIEKIKMSTDTPTKRFELSEKFFTEAKETEDELAMEGTQLKPISQDSVRYMLDGFLMGIAELRERNDPQLVDSRLWSVLNVVTRAVYGIGSGVVPEDKPLGSTYLNKEQIKYLCEQVNIVALFGFGKVHGMSTSQRDMLEIINGIAQRIVL